MGALLLVARYNLIMFNARHEQAMKESIEHHSSPAMVHHLIYTEHNGVRSPMQHMSTRINVPEKHIIRTVPHEPWQTKVKRAGASIANMGRKTGELVSKPFRHTKSSTRAEQLAHGYKKVDEFQKGITNRPIL